MSDIVSVPVRLILASASPRRQQLLRQIGYEPEIWPADVDERPCTDESALALVQRLACLKAQQCAVRSKHGETLVIVGSDTVIEFDGELLGKPVDQRHGITMLQRLADREHTVMSGVCVLRITTAAAEWSVISVRTQVRLGSISAQQATNYWKTGEPVDKAGGYAIQGYGAQFVASLSGSYSNVVGLPLYETNQLLQQAGVLTGHPA